MKKVSIFIALLLTFSLLATSAFAAQEATMSVSTSNLSVHRGDTFTVTVSVSSVDSCIAAAFMFNYDTSVFEYVSGKSLVSGATGSGITTVNGPLVGWLAKDGGMTVQGDLFEITFKVKDSADFGDYTITGTPSMKSKINGVDEVVSCSVNPVTVTIACDHSWDEGTTTKAPTCTEEGEITYTCSTCTETRIDSLPSTGHTNDKYTDNGDGTHTVACSVCDNIDNTAEAHTFVDGVCACGATEVPTDANLKFYSDKGDLMLGDEIKGSFVMNAKNRVYDDYYVEFKMGDAITNVPVSMTSGNYRYFFYTVFAFKMTETVEVTLYGVKDGVAYKGQSVTWTVRDSIVAKLDSWIGSYETDAKKAAACDLLANMLHYGTEAQKELNKENTNYPTDNLDERYLALIKTTTPEMGTKPADDESGKQATVYRMGMMLQEKIKLYAQFKVTNASATENSDYSAVIELTHKDGTTTKYEFGADQLSFSGTKTKYVTVQFDKVNCQEMRCTMKFALYLNGEQISATIVRSADMLANDLLATYPTLIPAIMNYSDCAERYFGM